MKLSKKIIFYFNELLSWKNIINYIFSSIVIILILIFKDSIISSSFITENINIFIFIFSLLIVYFLYKFIINKHYVLFKSSDIVIIDKLNIFFIIGIFITFSFISYNVLLLLFLLLIFIIIFIVRLYYYRFVHNNCDSNTYFLSNLYNNKIDKQDIVIIEDSPIRSMDDDILELNSYIDNLSYFLKNIKTKNNYIIGINSEWGIGKTSIINIIENSIKDNCSDIIIDTFNPWKYDDKRSLYRGLSDFIFRKIGDVYNYVDIRSSYLKYEKTIFDVIENFVGITYKKNDEEEFNKLKESVEKYISKSSKRLIIVIDDIDRIDSEQVLLLFKLLGSIYNFKGILYLLCFDDKRVNKIFNDNLKTDYNYINKVVKTLYPLPPISYSKMNRVCSVCIKNLLDIYEIDNYDEYRFKDVVGVIGRSINNLRNLIRFINQLSLSVKYAYKIGLDVCDYISLEYVKFLDYDCYQQVYLNDGYFATSNNIENNKNYYYRMDLFEHDSAILFDKLFKDKYTIKELLSILFTNVDCYRRNVRFYNSNRESRINKRCINSLVFDSYFTINKTLYLKIDNDLNGLINLSNNNKEIDDKLNNLLYTYDGNNIYTFFQMLELKINDFKKYDNLFYNLLNVANNDYYSEHLYVENYVSLMDIIIKKTRKSEFIYKLHMKNDFILDSVLGYLKLDINNNSNIKRIYDYGISLLNKKYSSYLKDNISIYDKKYYSKDLSLLFIHVFDEYDYNIYFNNIVNKDNIFVIIFDFTFYHRVDNKYKYVFKKELFNSIFNNNIINEIISELKNENLDKVYKSLLDIYEKGELKLDYEVNINDLF